jgi:cardiolipin synthase A/B
VTAAVTGHRVLAAADARAIGVAGAVLVALALLVALWPLILAIPFALLSVWFGGALLLRAYRLDRAPAQPEET